jgi:enoyl-CoA hydratase/carnithine racemase
MMGDAKNDLVQQSKIAYNQFKAEYIMIHAVTTCPTPIVAFVDGVAMGCGAGLAVHSKYTVVTEKASLAMPECDVGLFPDVAASYFLSRLPNQLGVYAGLTCHRFSAYELISSGLADEHVSSTSLAQIETALEYADSSAADSSVGSILSRFATEPMAQEPSTDLRYHTSRIRSCFSQDSVEGIIGALQMQQQEAQQQKDEGVAEWCNGVVQVLRSKSPTSLKIAHRALTMGLTMDKRSCLELDFRIMVHIFDPVDGLRDFQEGVRAVLVDKTKDAKWQPASLELLSNAEVDVYFKPLLGGSELILPS